MNLLYTSENNIHIHHEQRFRRFDDENLIVSINKKIKKVEIIHSFFQFTSYLYMIIDERYEYERKVLYKK